jgi:multiple sugar transport system ATP-binding protein
VSATLDAARTSIDLSGYSFAVRPVEGTRLSIGLRPEHFTVGGANGAAQAAAFDLPVRHCEKAGSDATAYLDADGQIVAVRIDPSRVRTLKAGDRLRLSFPLDRINVFDAQTGRRL